MKRLWNVAWKILKWLGANLPFFLCLAAAFYFGIYLDGREELHFWIIMATFYVVLREVYEMRKYLKMLAEMEMPEEEERLDTDELPLQRSELREIRVILERLLEDQNGEGGRHSGHQEA